MAPLLIANEATIIIIVLLALVLFGGSRIAGVGKGAGRAIRVLDGMDLAAQSGVGRCRGPLAGLREQVPPKGPTL